MYARSVCSLNGTEMMTRSFFTFCQKLASVWQCSTDISCWCYVVFLTVRLNSKPSEHLQSDLRSVIENGLAGKNIILVYQYVYNVYTSKHV